jgi:hypothetical protein
MNAIKTLIFTILVPGTLAVLIPYRLASSPGVGGTVPLGSFRFLGLPLIAAGVLIYLWCAWDFASAGKGTPAPIDPPKELVVRGLYRHVRNPMYVGVLSLVLGQAFWFEALSLFLLPDSASALQRLCILLRPGAHSQVWRSVPKVLRGGSSMDSLAEPPGPLEMNHRQLETSLCPTSSKSPRQSSWHWQHQW